MARNPGSLRAVVRRYLRGDVNVPCDGCTACCRSKMRVPDGNGGFLAKRDDGSCVHLIDGQCSIYERRPPACRAFDCRIMRAVRVLPVDDPELLTGVMQWDGFDLSRPEDRAMRRAIDATVWGNGAPGSVDEAIAKLRHGAG